MPRLRRGGASSTASTRRSTFRSRGRGKSRWTSTSTFFLDYQTDPRQCRGLLREPRLGRRRRLGRARTLSSHNGLRSRHRRRLRPRRRPVGAGFPASCSAASTSARSGGTGKRPTSADARVQVRDRGAPRHRQGCRRGALGALVRRPRRRARRGCGHDRPLAAAILGSRAAGRWSRPPAAWRSPSPPCPALAAAGVWLVAFLLTRYASFVDPRGGLAAALGAPLRRVLARGRLHGRGGAGDHRALHRTNISRLLAGEDTASSSTARASGRSGSKPRLRPCRSVESRVSRAHLVRGTMRLQRPDGFLWPPPFETDCYLNVNGAEPVAGSVWRAEWPPFASSLRKASPTVPKRSARTSWLWIVSKLTWRARTKFSSSRSP